MSLKPHAPHYTPRFDKIQVEFSAAAPEMPVNFLYAPVLAPGGNAPAYMPLGFVDVQYFAGLQVQAPVELRQALGDVLMYSGLADMEPLGGGADGRPVLYDVQREAFGALFHVPFQTATLPGSFCPFYAPGGESMTKTRLRGNCAQIAQKRAQNLSGRREISLDTGEKQWYDKRVCTAWTDGNGKGGGNGFLARYKP